MNNEIYDVVIIGGASAGLTAGIYCGRKKLNTVILTSKVGGQSLLTNEIENYPGFDMVTGPELAQKIRNQVEKVGVPIKESTAVTSISKAENGFVVKTEDGEEYQTKTVLIATGKKVRRLGVPGEADFEGKGISFCSICDAPLFGGKDVVVVGGGNSGLESAIDLLKYANKVYVLEGENKLRGDELLQDKIKESSKTEIITNAKVTEINGDKFVSGLKYKDSISGETKELKVGGIFIHIGFDPAAEFVKGFVELNSFGEVIIGKYGETSVPGIFAAGDVTDTKYKQYTVAVGEGAKAALSAYEFLSRK